MAQTWATNPSTSDWNTATNWSPATVPDSTTASATLSSSSVTNLSLSADVSLGSLVEDYPSSTDYSISTNGHTLSFWGSGLTYSQGGTLTIGGDGIVEFHNSSSAGLYGTHIFTADSGGQFVFYDTSNGGDSKFTVNAGAQFDISQLTSAGMTVGSIGGAGDFYLGSKALTVTAEAATVSGVIADGGLGGGTGGTLCVSGGKLVLSGGNTYSGGTSILGAELDVANPNALGTGSVYNNGILAGGGIPTTIRIQGNYTEDYWGYTFLNLGGTGAGQYDTLRVSGAATLNGTFGFYAVNGYQPHIGDTFTILTAQSVNPGISFLPYGPYPDMFATTRPRLEIFPTSVVLQVIPKSFSQYAVTPNELAFANDLDQDYISQGLNGIITGLIALPTSGYAHAYDQATMEPWTAFYRAGFEEMDGLVSGIGGRLAELRDDARRLPNPGSFGPGFLRTGGLLAAAGFSDRDYMGPDGPGDNGHSDFLSAESQSVQVRSDTNAQGYDFSTNDFTLGELDYRSEKNVVMGAVFGYSHTDITLDGAGTGKVDGGRAGLFVTWFPSDFHMDLVAALGLNFYNLQRMGFDETLGANTQGIESALSLGAGYDLKVGTLTFTPYGAVHESDVELLPVKEIGPIFSDGTTDQNEESRVGEWGLKVSGNWKTGGLELVPSLCAAWKHEYMMGLDSLKAGLDTSGLTFTYPTVGPNLGRDWALLEVGLNLRWSDRTFTYLNYRSEMGRLDLASQSFIVGMNIGI